MSSTNKLCIFHMDFNFSCLREDYLRKWLKKISESGYNAILWEIEDKVHLESCPECVWPEALSKEQFKDILEYSRSLGLEPIPLLQTVGHAEYILMHKEYRHLRESMQENHHDCYCTENPDTRKFLKEMIAEYLELFGDIRYFHLGGDEAYVFATCDICSPKADQIGRNSLYMEHISDLSAAIRDAGVRPGIWCDMILHYPEEIEAVSNEYIIWDWNYRDCDIPQETAHIWGGAYLKPEELSDEIKTLFPEMLREDGKIRPFYTAHTLKRMGYEVILCSATRASGDSPLLADFNRRSGNIAGAARTCADLDLLGTCATSWAIRLNPFEAQEPLLPLAPELLKNPDLTLPEAESLVSKELFGIESCEFFDTIKMATRNIPPFLKPPSMAIQWSMLKDSLPAPANFLEDQFSKWRNESNNYTLNLLTEQLRKAEEELPNALYMLKAFTMKAEKGFDILEYFSDIITMQFWMTKVAKMIFGNKISAETSEILATQKVKYLNMLSKVETPKSATKNTDLIFDWLLEYCENKSTKQ